MSKDNNITFKMVASGAIVIILGLVGFLFRHDVIEQIEKNSTNQINLISEIREYREKSRELTAKQQLTITRLDTQLQLIQQDRKYIEQKFNRVYSQMEEIQEVVHLISKDLRTGKYIGRAVAVTRQSID